MKNNNFQKKFIVHICEYQTDVQGFLLKDILQNFLDKENKHGLEVSKDKIFILIDNNKIRDNQVNLNDITYNIYSLIYLLYEFKKNELIYFSNTIINSDFKYSVTNFKNDYKVNINIDKSKFFLDAINSQIFMSAEIRPLILCKRFFFDVDLFLFWIGVLVSIATIISTIYDILAFHFNK